MAGKERRHANSHESSVSLTKLSFLSRSQW